MSIITQRRRHPSPSPSPFGGHGRFARADTGNASTIAASEPARPFHASAGTSCTIRADRGPDKLPTFKGTAYTGAPMKPQGWWQSVIIDLDGVKVPSQHRPALRQHDHEQIVGHTESVKVDAEGIKIRGVFSGEKQHVEKVTEPARNGFRWQLSVGANPTRTEFLEAGETTTVNGREITGPMTISRETEIGEISFVPLGADGDTSVSIAASAAGAPPRFDILDPDCLRKMSAWECNRLRAKLGLPPLGTALGITARDSSDLFRPGHSFGTGAVASDRPGALQLPEALKGVALIFGRVWAPAPRCDAQMRPVAGSGQQRVLVFEGALDDALRDFTAGRLRLPLCLNHDLGQELCSNDTAALDLRLSQDGQRVRFKLGTDSAAGKQAAHAILTAGLRGLSLGLLPREICEDPTLPGYLGIIKADIRDVSAVQQARCPGCCLKT